MVVAELEKLSRPIIMSCVFEQMISLKQKAMTESDATSKVALYAWSATEPTQANEQ